VHPVAAVTKVAAADRRSNLSEGYRASIGHLLTLSPIREMFSANHTAKRLVVTDEETITEETYGRSVGHIAIQPRFVVRGQ
jgi:hypothetical protein